MNNRGPLGKERLGDRIERVRRLAGGHPTAPSSGRRRRVSRREREAKRQRQIRWAVGIAGALAIAVLVVSATNEYFIKPRTVLASVNGTDIRRRDYWKVRSMNLIQEASQYQQFAGFVQGDQQTQYLQLAAQRRAELEDVWGSTDLDDPTLQQMIDDQVMLTNLDQLGLQLEDRDVADYIARQFGPSESGLAGSSPTPTLIPARAEWATQTAVAGEATAEASTAAARASGPVPTSAVLPSAPGLVVSSGATPTATPSTAGTPAPEPTGPAPTPNADEARATASANFETFGDNVFDEAHMTREDYERLIARPAVARQKITDTLNAEVGQSADQVHAAHILVSTSDLARDIFNRLQQPGADFSSIAREESTDQATAGNGGDLGWFTRSEMVAPFAKAAFALEPGSISEPFQTEFGWHIVRVIERQDDRAMTDQQIQKVQDSRLQEWLNERKAGMDIESDIDPTPTPIAQPFQPPVDAPPPATEAAVATGTPAASPVSAPNASPAP